MPRLDTTLHIDMYRAAKKRRTLPSRIKQALKILLGRDDLYGMEWGDPDTRGPLTYIRDRFLLPYVTDEATVVEIGPGGGRWTRYMLGVRRLYAVEFHEELLTELRSRFRRANLAFVRNNGTDFPGIANHSVDFIFSFDTFVHLDVDIIEEYLENMKSLVTPASNIVIHYSDKSKPMAQRNSGFSQNDPETMRRLVSSHGYFIYEEDVKTLCHSAVIRFGTREADVPQRTAGDAHVPCS